MASNRFSKLHKLHLVWRAQGAFRYAQKRKALGIEFASFGRQVGLRLLMRQIRSGINYLVVPVNLARYFEFPFALSCLPEFSVRCLDLSSPNLFSFYVAKKIPSAKILMINPDTNDISQSDKIASALGLDNIRTKCSGVEHLPDFLERYDCIWSISVVEHICGAIDDGVAVKLMYNTLRDGGRLILTVPVDREFRNEYRDCDYYGTSVRTAEGKFFFQRFYDKATIWDRLLAPIGEQPTVVRWWGETSPGRFADHEQRAMRDGYNCIVDDPKELADYYREYASWEEMPGAGVCGLMIEKKLSKPTTGEQS